MGWGGHDIRSTDLGLLAARLVRPKNRVGAGGEPRGMPSTTAGVVGRWMAPRGIAYRLSAIPR